MNKLNLVAFLILMQNGEGIMEKSPDYIMEKYNRYVLSEKEDEFMWGLDAPNQYKMNQWRLQWDEEYKLLQGLRK